MDFWTRIVVKKENVVARHVAGEDLLIPISGRLADMQRIFAVDPVAAHIWKMLDGSVTLESVLKSVVEAFDVAEEKARVDIMAFVGQLDAAGLILDAPRKV